jgi:hypothetical protein
LFRICDDGSEASGRPRELAGHELSSALKVHHVEAITTGDSEQNLYAVSRVVDGWSPIQQSLPSWRSSDRNQKMRPFTATKVLAERVGDLAPTEGRSDSSQDCLHDMRIVGNA